MRPSTTPPNSHTWTSGAVALRRRRHRLVALSVTAGLLAAAMALTAASAHGLVRLPNGFPGSGPAFVDADPGIDEVGPVLPAPDVEDAEVVAEPGRDDDPAEAPDEVVEQAPPAEATPTEEEPAPAEPAPAEPPAEDDGLEEGPASEEAPTEAEPEPEETPKAEAVDTAAVQTRLRELGYLIGPADGTKGQQTIAAVMAFQRVNGLQVDGVVGPQTLAALESPVRAPELRGGPENRIEVDLDRQILHLVQGGERVVTLKVSSGSGQPYPTASGGTAIARTPVGEFVIERRIHGVRNARLGTLYDPLYFYSGFAIHGSLSVPAGPASSGCVRITRADAAWLIQQVPNGTPVHLYGGSHVFSPSS